LALLLTLLGLIWKTLSLTARSGSASLRARERGCTSEIDGWHCKLLCDKAETMSIAGQSRCRFWPNHNET
jgi:hypothetical protein